MKRYALIVSCEEYKEFDDISFCHGDAVLIYDTLLHYCDYKTENVELLTLYTDNDSITPTTLYDKLSEIITSTTSEDTVLFYFAGHGMLSENNNYLILPDTIHNCISTTALSLKEINTIVKQGNCISFVLLDACHSGIMPRGISNNLFIENIKDKSYATLASCSENECSYPDPNIEQGVFTYSVAEAIKNWHINEEIFLETLKTEVCSRVHKWCEENSKQQTPTLNGCIVGNMSFATRNKNIYEYSQLPVPTQSTEVKTMKNTEIGVVHTTPVLWQSNTGIQLPKVSNTETILSYNCQLKDRDLVAILTNYKSGIFELASEAIWNRSITILRKRVLALGLQFVSEMVGVDNLDYIRELPAFEVINLAMELGFIDITGKMRLMHANEIVQHYLQREISEEMPQLESDSVIRPCIQYILGYEDSDIQVDYCDFREYLKQQPIDNDIAKLEMLKTSPYFYQKTTIRTLINLIASTDGAEFEMVSSNFVTILKAVWDFLTSDDKYFIGLTFSKYKNQGDTTYITVFYNSLLQVEGFDYVPENLRSLSFIESARKVKQVHYALNNFYNEPGAIKKLEKMGSRIPKPAIKEVIGATLMVLLGNTYGRSYDAIDSATDILNKLSTSDWLYYIEQCLVNDEDVLIKISAGDIRTERWCGLTQSFKLEEIEYNNTKIISFIAYSSINDIKNTKACANTFLKKVTVN